MSRYFFIIRRHFEISRCGAEEICNGGRGDGGGRGDEEVMEC